MATKQNSSKMEVFEPDNEQSLRAFPAGKPTFQSFQITTSHVKKARQILKHTSREILTRQFDRKVVREELCRRLNQASFISLFGSH